MSVLFKRIEEGGLFSMLPILLVLLIVLVFIVKGAIRNGDIKKTISLIGSFGLFALVWGIFGQVLGLIQAFDSVEEAGDVALSILANGIKFTFLSTLFGLLVFIIARIGIIFLTWREK